MISISLNPLVQKICGWKITQLLTAYTEWQWHNTHMNFQGVERTKPIHFVLHNILWIHKILLSIIYLFPFHYFQINIKNNVGNSQNSTAAIVTRLCAGQHTIQSLAVTRYSHSLSLSLQVQPTLLLNGYRRPFRSMSSSWSTKLTPHLYTVPSLRSRIHT